LGSNEAVTFFLTEASLFLARAALPLARQGEAGAS
jgi:hypothetical protein